MNATKEAKMHMTSRDENEQIVRLLADRYPKCFFTNPRLRKPLKKEIVADLHKDGVPVAYELLVLAVNWYQSHFGYQYALQAGAKRIDLHCKEVGTVTEQDHYGAQNKIREDKQKLGERSRNDAVRTIHSLHANGRISSDQIRKLDAPLLTKPMRPPMSPPIELNRVFQALAAASELMMEDRDALHSAMAAAALGVVINETQRVIDGFQNGNPSGQV
jgi:sRNA-binding protein